MTDDDCTYSVDIWDEEDRIETKLGINNLKRRPASSGRRLAD
ncbi:hypothetical protein [Bacillus swezeyi]